MFRSNRKFFKKWTKRMAHACPNPTFRVKKALDLSEKYAESLRSFSITVMKKKKPFRKHLCWSFLTKRLYQEANFNTEVFLEIRLNFSNSPRRPEEIPFSLKFFKGSGMPSLNCLPGAFSEWYTSASNS